MYGIDYIESDEPAPKLAKWRRGYPAAAWEFGIIEQNEERAIRTINGLGTILFGGVIPGAGPVDFEAQCDVLAKLSGKQIAGALRDYWRVTQMEKAWIEGVKRDRII